MGREKENIRSLIKKSGLEKNFHLLGEKTHEEVLQLMQQARVFLHTSRYEGFSTVCLEALYAGAHVISFCDPMEGIIPHWHIVHNENEMTKKLIDILQQPAIEYKSILLFVMDDSAKAIMNLFEK
jgi:glycosyltransferase involved in cell wall biosynthesis